MFKMVTILGVCVATIVVITGCTPIQSTTRAPTIGENAVPKLLVKKPVALRNASSSGDILVGKLATFYVYADLRQYTESAIGAAKKVLARQKIAVDDGAEKILVFRISNVKTELLGFRKIKVKTTLRVKTGDGLSKVYQVSQNYRSRWATTSAVQKTIARALEQMFNDDAILKYLSN